MYDVIIIGAGPSGLTAAIYLLRENKKVLILESEGIGGQIASSPKVENYPGFISISGAELSNNLYEQVLSLGGTIELEKAVEIKNGEIKKVITEDNTYETKVIILAVGAKYKLLGLPHEDEFIGNGISFCTTCDGAFYKNKIVAVIGGGNSAVTNAIYMADIASKVYLVHRSENFRCEKNLLDKFKGKPNTEVITNSTITEYIGDNELKAIVLNNERTIELNGLFLSVGHTAQNELLKGLIDLSDDEYALSNENCETNIKGIFVSGDIRNKKIRQLTTAVSDGTVSALNTLKYLESID